VTGTRLRIQRIGAIFAAGLLIVAALPAAAAAGETRLLYVGDPAQVNAPPTPYEIHPTAVSNGNISFFDVLIKNKGKQTLTSAAIGMGTLIANNPDGTAGPALPNGWKIENVVSLSGVTPNCVTDPVSSVPATGLIQPDGDYVGFSCNFGNLAKGSPGGAIRVYLKAGSSLSASSAIQVSGKVAENVGGNVGSNTNTFFALGAGSFYFSGAGVVAGLFNDKSITPSTHKSGAPQTTIDITTITGDYVVSVEEIDSTDSSFPACPQATPCLDSAGASRVHVNFGNPVNPYFEWTMLFPVSSSYKLKTSSGIVHFLDGGGTETFYNVSQTSCLKPHAKVPCADFSLVTDLAGNLYVQVRFDTTTNGSGRLF